MSVLKLTLKKKWFDMIASGEKKEEYREIKAWSASRVLNLKKQFREDKYQISYDNVRKAFAYCWGRYSTRQAALAFLLDNGFCDFQDYTTILFTNGYGKHRPAIEVECKGIRLGTGKEDWGAVAGEEYFVIHLGEVIRKVNF